jgi:hypothetical protein
VGAAVTGCLRGQAAPEFVLITSLLAAALFLPWFDGVSASTLLTRRIAEAFHGLFFLIAVS